MQLTKTDKKILKKYKKVFEMLENYDKTREFPFHKKRIDIKTSCFVPSG